MLNSKDKSTKLTSIWPPLKVLQYNKPLEKIDQFTSFIAQRQSDRATSKSLLDLENEQYAEEAQIFSDLQNKYQRDIAVTEEAYQMVKSVDFSKIKVWLTLYSIIKNFIHIQAFWVLIFDNQRLKYK